MIAGSKPAKRKNTRPKGAGHVGRKVEYLVPERPLTHLVHTIGSALARRIKPVPNAVWFLACAVVLVMSVEVLSLGLSAKNDKKEILGVATSAYSEMNSGAQNLTGNDFQNALTLFDSAQNNLKAASDKLNGYKLVSWAVPSARTADSILRGAYLLASSGKDMASAMQQFDQVKIDSAGTGDIVSLVTENRALLLRSLDNLKAARELFSTDSGVPAEYAQTLAKGREQTTALIGVLQELINLENVYLAMIGGQSKTYLLVFQNYDEMRATGGFIGTYGTLKLSGGKIDRLNIESVYNLDGSIHQQIAAPGPFQPDIKKWGMRDANWFADFPTSAQKLLYFYELGRETADGVIAVTPKLFVDLLRITGPIEMPNYGATLNADNFQTVVQNKTSVEYDKVLNQPKKFLADFAPIFLDRLSSLDKQQKLSMFQALSDAFRQKHILIYSKDSRAQEEIRSMGLAGEIKDTPGDYLSVFNTNMGGTKTDLAIEQKINLESKILSDGSVLDQVRITRQNSDNAMNRDFLRILVPEGSTLVSASGFDRGNLHASEAEGYAPDKDLQAWDQGNLKFNQVFEAHEAGKTEYRGWVETAPQAGKTVTLSYILPFKIKTGFLSGSAPYSLLYQKQPGMVAAQFTASLDFGPYKTDWSSENSNGAGNATLTSDSSTDRLWSFILKHE
ncbi:MAG: DUF4012 domain-containing protein [Candidatus Saccharibacteria bacterium]